MRWTRSLASPHHDPAHERHPPFSWVFSAIPPPTLPLIPATGTGTADGTADATPEGRPSCLPQGEMMRRGGEVPPNQDFHVVPALADLSEFLPDSFGFPFLSVFLSRCLCHGGPQQQPGPGRQPGPPGPAREPRATCPGADRRCVGTPRSYRSWRDARLVRSECMSVRVCMCVCAHTRVSVCVHVTFAVGRVPALPTRQAPAGAFPSSILCPGFFVLCGGCRGPLGSAVAAGGTAATGGQAAPRRPPLCPPHPTFFLAPNRTLRGGWAPQTPDRRSNTEQLKRIPGFR